MGLLDCHHISLNKKQQVLFHDISFSAQEGEFVGIAGPSGSGKTSLLRTLNNLDPLSSGTIKYRGNNIADYNPQQLRREVGYVHQKPFLFGMSVLDNLEFPYRTWGEKPNRKEISKYIDKVSLSQNIIKKRGNELSGGEQQRVAVIRSILAKPNILLLDEISSSLDDQNKLIIEQTIKEENFLRNTTIIFVSHDVKQISRLSQKLLYLDHGKMKYFGDTQYFYEDQEAQL